MTGGSGYATQRPRSPPRVPVHPDVAEARLRISEARARSDALREQLEEVQAQNARLGQELALEQATNLDLQSQIAAAASERAAAEGRLASVRNEAISLEDEARSLESVRHAMLPTAPCYMRCSMSTHAATRQYMPA